jgi:hypothetical protein
MEFKKMSIGRYSYGVDQPRCRDAVERDVTNFNFEDEQF